MAPRIRIAFDLSTLEKTLEHGLTEPVKGHSSVKEAATQWAAAIRHVLESREDPTEWVKATLQVRRVEKDSWRRFPYEAQVEAHYVLPAREVLERAAHNAKIDPAALKKIQADHGTLKTVYEQVAKLHAAQFADEVKSSTTWQDEIERGDLGDVLNSHTVGLETGPEGWKVEGVDQPRVTSSVSSDGHVTTVLHAIVRLQEPFFENNEDDPSYEPRYAADVPYLRLVRDDETPGRGPAPRREPSDADRAAQAAFDRAVVGKTGEGDKLRWHVYRNNVEVTELAGAGKPGKRLRQVKLLLPDRALPEAAYLELTKFLRLMLSEHAHYEGVVTWFKKFYAQFGPQVINWRDPIEETTLRGVDVNPRGSKFKLPFNEERGEITATPTSVFISWRSGINDLKGGPDAGRDTKKVYKWMDENRARVPHMSWVDLFGAVRRETGVTMDHH
mgnify:CR=1 FL=1